MMQSALPLSSSLAHVGALLDQARPQFSGARSLGLPDAFIDLPAFEGGLSANVSAAELRTVASLYFLAELEGTYLIAVAEELGRARFSLNLTDSDAAQALEDLATHLAGDWVDTPLRNQIFVRVFGIGDVESGPALSTPEFEPRFAAYIAALQATSRALSWGPAGAEAARVGVSGLSFLATFGQRMQGNTLLVAEKLTTQLRLSLAALNQPGLAALFQGRTAWDVVRGVLGNDTPDLTGHVNRAQTGLRLLSWTAQHLDIIKANNTPQIAQAIAAEPQLASWGHIWLEASGLVTRTNHNGSAWLQ